MFLFAGDVFVFSLGSTQIVHVTRPEMVREITTCTSLDLGKPTYQAKERGALLGRGILTSNGPHWVHQRRILAPELYMDKVKVQNPIKLRQKLQERSLNTYIKRQYFVLCQLSQIVDMV